MRRFGEPVRPDRTYTTRPGAYGVIRDGGNVLITRQDGPDPEFQLPGGGIDPGESAIRALHRECLEETGWRIGALRRLGAFQRYVFLPEYDIWARKVCHVYLARPTLRRGAPVEPGHSAFWMSIETAMRLVGNDGDRAFLMRLAGRRRR